LRPDSKVKTTPVIARDSHTQPDFERHSVRYTFWQPLFVGGSSMLNG
jgi:hypothetical protein